MRKTTVALTAMLALGLAACGAKEEAAPEAAATEAAATEAAPAESLGTIKIATQSPLLLHRQRSTRSPERLTFIGPPGNSNSDSASVFRSTMKECPPGTATIILFIASTRCTCGRVIPPFQRSNW